MQSKTLCKNKRKINLSYWCVCLNVKTKISDYFTKVSL